MTTRQGPKEPSDEVLVSRAVAGQVDAVKRQLAGLERKVDKLGEGFTVVLQRLDQRDKKPTGQPDWLHCRKASDARTILAAVTAWLEDCGAVLDIRPRPCWPWHPEAVVTLLALAQHYRQAYSGESAVTVADLLTRYVKAYREALGRGGDQCTAAYHLLGEAQFAFDLDRIDDYAIWWATSREGLPPGLAPRDRMSAVG